MKQDIDMLLMTDTPQVVKDQLDSHPEIADLMASMDGVYSFANNLCTSALAIISTSATRNTMFTIVHQTFEFLIFIQEYVGCGFSSKLLIVRH